jgi:CTP-dependent riboflavin kinase
MKAISGHLVLKGKKDYRDVAKVFPEVLRTFLQETDQMPEDEDVLEMFIQLNMAELQRNGKPEGYNRKGRMRLVFPLTRKEFYIRGMTRSGEVVRVTEKISRILSKGGIDHEVEWNALSSIEE